MNSIAHPVVSFDVFRSELARAENSDPWYLALRQAAALGGGIGAIQSLQTHEEFMDRLYSCGGNSDWILWS